MEMQPLYELGASEVIPEEFETSVEIFSRVLANYLIPRDEIDKLVVHLRADGYEMFRNLSGKSFPVGNLDLQLPDVGVSSMRVEEGSFVVGMSLVKLELRKKYGVTVFAVCRDSQTFLNPEVDQSFYADDILYVIGSPEKLSEIGKLFNRGEKR